MTREVVGHPHLMMTRASELGRLVDHLDDAGMSGQRDGSRAEGTSVAVPILLSLAAEIGLKAWQCRERNGPPDKTHDLLALFDALGENTRRRLEDKMPEVPSLVARLPPYYPGIRDALSQNKNLFVASQIRARTPFSACRNRHVLKIGAQEQLSRHIFVRGVLKNGIRQRVDLSGHGLRDRRLRRSPYRAICVI